MVAAANCLAFSARKLAIAFSVNAQDLLLNMPAEWQVSRITTTEPEESKRARSTPSYVSEYCVL